jgi:hypothetical protein
MNVLAQAGRAITLALLLGALPACSQVRAGGAFFPDLPFVPLQLRGQKVPKFILRAKPDDFKVGDDVVVMHYYGVGGWGIKWRKTYLMTGAFFSNHSMEQMIDDSSHTAPDIAAIRQGFAGTPSADTNVLLLGHGHIDHAGDVSGYFEAGLPKKKMALIADDSTVNILAPLRDQFSCVHALNEDSRDKRDGPCQIPHVRITPIPAAHAPHTELFGISVLKFSGRVGSPRKELSDQPKDFLEGFTWAYLIDLLDDQGKVAFRIHYVDAASTPHSGIAQSSIRAERDVDVHIGCVAGFDGVDQYPDGVLQRYNTKFVLAGHWEDFFESRTKPLKLVRFILDEKKLHTFIGRIDKALGSASRGGEPINKDAKSCHSGTCGPHAATWALPVPGETYHFKAGGKK